MRVTRTGMILGTPAYAPPEQLLGEPLDARSDIYSVGATLYFLLTGVLSFPGANAMVVLASVLQGTPTSPETHQPAILKALSAIVVRAMARQPSERFADYSEFRAALDALSGDEVVPGRPLERVLAFLIDMALASLIATARSATGSISHLSVCFGLVASGPSLIPGGLVLWEGLQHPARGLGDRSAGTTTVPE